MMQTEKELQTVNKGKTDMGNYTAERLGLRYIVPIMLTKEYGDVCRVLEQDEDWELQKLPSPEPGEMAGMTKSDSDLYTYIKDEFLAADSYDDIYKQGSEWRMKKTAAAFRETEWTEFCPEGLENPSGRKRFRIKAAGLRLYRNRMGMFWFEVLFKAGEEPDARELVAFQHEVKSMTTFDKLKFWQESSVEEEKEETVERFGIVTGSVSLKEGRRLKYSVPFYFCNWVERTLSVLRGNFFYLNGGVTKKLDELQKKAAKRYLEQYPEEGRVLGGAGQDREVLKGPRKSLIFSYCLFEGEEGTEEEPEERTRRSSLAYHLTNGYKEVVRCSRDVYEEMHRPFAYAIWYATQEGATCTMWTDQENRENRRSVEGRFLSDYFTLYLKVLYQSLSLLYYADLIQKKIPVVTGKDSGEIVEVSSLYKEISLFLTKSMATSVSFTHHQVDFYVYLKDRLRIHADVKSVTAGLESIDAVLREERRKEEQREIREREDREKESDQKLQVIMGFLAVLGIGSAFMDWYQFIRDVTEEGEWVRLSGWRIVLELVVLVVLLVISVYCVSYFIRSIRKKPEKMSGKENA